MSDPIAQKTPSLTPGELDTLIGMLHPIPTVEYHADLLHKLRMMKRSAVAVPLSIHCPRCPYSATGGMRRLGDQCPNCGTLLVQAPPPSKEKVTVCGYCHYKATDAGTSCSNCNIPYAQKPPTAWQTPPASMQWLKLRSAIYSAAETLKRGQLPEFEALKSALADFEEQKPEALSPVLMSVAQVLADLMRGNVVFTNITDFGDMLHDLIPGDQLEKQLAYFGSKTKEELAKEREDHALTKTSLRVTTTALRDVEVTLDEVARLIGRVHEADGQNAKRAFGAAITKRVRELVEAEERAVVPRSVTIVDALLHDMEQDNGATFKVGHASYTKLVSGVEKMLQAGCAFTPEQITQIASGEGQSLGRRFARFNGWSDVNAVMDAIFDGADGPEDTNDDPEDGAPPFGD